MKKQTIAFVNDDAESIRVIDAGMFKEFLRDFGAGAKLKLTIEHYHYKRSNKQNRVLWWYIDEVSTETGISKDEVKNFFDLKYLKVEIRDVNNEIRCDLETGEVMTRIKSTTELSTTEFNTYTEQIRLYCNDFFGFSLPLPNDQPELKFSNIE